MENIQVALRVRPLNQRELQRGEENIWKIHQKKMIALSNQFYEEVAISKRLSPISKSTFCFDYCFPQQDNNIEVYNKVVKRVALSSLNGINGTIFMYGQTGAGKTYTMMGATKNDDTEELSRPSYNPEEEKLNDSNNSPRRKHNHTSFITETTENTGILILALKDLFNKIENVRHSFKY